MIDFLRTAFKQHPDREAVIWHGQAQTYGRILELLDKWAAYLESQAVPSGTVVALRADFSPNAIALLLALVERGCILVPLSESVRVHQDEFLETSECELVLDVSAADEVVPTRTGRHASHPLLAELRSRKSPGLVLFSSGSTGKSKAAVHDFGPILEKFRTPRKSMRTVTFLLYDHIGGINTLLYVLANAGTVITVGDRSPDGVLAAAARHRAELLPASPTFLNLVLLSGAYANYDLSALRLITYGTEPMPEATLKRLREVLPTVELQQTYGLSELGILRTKSRSSDSLWVRIGGEGFETRVVEGLLQIKARSAMLGYLNAPSPFTEDGWFMTGDAVEVDGEFMKILGRKSELINVGGQKVYPAEVEGFIQGLSNVAEVTVYPEKNLLTGNMVCARIRLTDPEDAAAASLRIRKACRSALPSCQVPVRIVFAEDLQYSARFKKKRV